MEVFWIILVIYLVGLAGCIFVGFAACSSSGRLEMFLDCLSAGFFWPLWIIRGVWWLLSDAAMRFGRYWKEFGE